MARRRGVGRRGVGLGGTVSGVVIFEWQPEGGREAATGRFGVKFTPGLGGKRRAPQWEGVWMEQSD